MTVHLPALVLRYCFVRTSRDPITDLVELEDVEQIVQLAVLLLLRQLDEELPQRCASATCYTHDLML